MSNRVLRARKDGGFSYCSAPEDKVGHGRCVHIPGIAFKMSRSKNGINFVEIKEVSDSSLSPGEVKAKVEEVEAYMRGISEELSKEKREKILDFFRSKNM